jgi:hypothetical protein
MKLFVNHPLAKKVAVVAVIKMVALFVLWWAFFSEPQEEKLTADEVSSAILHPSTRNPHTP